MIYWIAKSTTALPNGQDWIAGLAEGKFSLRQVKAAIARLRKRLAIEIGEPIIADNADLQQSVKRHYDESNAYRFYYEDGEFVAAENWCRTILKPEHELHQVYAGFATATYTVGDNLYTQVFAIPPFSCEEMKQQDALNAARRKLFLMNDMEQVHGLQKIEIFKLPRKPCLTYSPKGDTCEN